MINLNLGAGSNRKQDYVSVDLYEDADLKHDLRETLHFQDGEVDNIYACHVIEHFSRAEWEKIRKDWARVIREGGNIEIRCPDIVKVCERMMNDPYDPFNMMTLYGGQHTEGEYHKNGFTQQSLTDSFPGFIARLLEPSSDYELHMIFTKEGENV